MSWLTRPRLLLAAALIVTLAWKLSVPVDSVSHLQVEIIGFLERLEFDAAVTDATMDNFPIIDTRKNGCRMQVMKASYYGASRDEIQELKPPGGTVLFIYRGKTYAEQPVWQIVSDQIVMRLLRSLRLVAHEPPVLAAAAEAACGAADLPWQELQ